MTREVERITRRMVRRAKAGESGRGWYGAAWDAIRARYGAGAGLWADLFAATSPRSSVSANVTLADRAWNLLRQGRPVADGAPYGIAGNLGNVTRAAEGRPLRGPKVRAFAEALRGNPDAVAVDVWMYRAAYGRQADGRDVWATPTRTENVTRACRAAARRLGWTPREVQAAVWWTERSGRHGSGDLAGILSGHTPAA